MSVLSGEMKPFWSAAGNVTSKPFGVGTLRKLQDKTNDNKLFVKSSDRHFTLHKCCVGNLPYYKNYYSTAKSKLNCIQAISEISFKI